VASAARRTTRHGEARNRRSNRKGRVPTTRIGTLSGCAGLRRRCRSSGEGAEGTQQPTVNPARAQTGPPATHAGCSATCAQAAARVSIAIASRVSPSNTSMVKRGERRMPAMRRGREAKRPRPLRSQPRRGRSAGRMPYRRISRMGLGRVELPTSRLSGVRSNHLSYRPSTGTGE
jgi:hypothetical protein